MEQEKEFVAKHGQEMLDLVKQYRKGIRTPETTSAMTLYQNQTQGRIREVFTVYGILEDGKVVYVGSTSATINARWNEHKYDARTLRRKLPQILHSHMNTVSSNHDIFPEFTPVVFEELNDENAAKALEKSLIIAYKTHITGFNKQIGGGGKRTKYISTRPANAENFERR